MENILNGVTMSIFLRLFIAVILGMIIGTERVWAHKTAGMRTYALVSMGAALFIIISELIIVKYINIGGFDPTRMASQIIVGIGFLGAGSIMLQGSRLKGLTTASGLWVCAGIGMATGLGLFNIAIIATVLVLFIFIILWFIEKKIKNSKFYKEDHINDLE